MLQNVILIHRLPSTRIVHAATTNLPAKTPDHHAGRYFSLRCTCRAVFRCRPAHVERTLSFAGSPEEDRKLGTIQWFDTARGYGFLETERNRCFLPPDCFQMPGFRSVAEVSKLSSQRSSAAVDATCCESAPLAADLPGRKVLIRQEDATSKVSRCSPK